MSSSAIPLRTREAIEEEVRRRVETERARLVSQRPRAHFTRPAERAFTAAERDRVTILFGGLTWKHEALVTSVFQAAASGEPGLTFNVDFGMGAFSALNVGDILNDITYQIRPFEVNAGDTDRVMNDVMHDLTRAVRARRAYEIDEHAPRWVFNVLRGRKTLRNTLNTLGKIHDHLYGRQTIEALAAARERIGAIEVDRLRVKPVVKVTGEFWAQTTEGDGNFRMFSFLEREGAQVMVESIGTWVMYVLWRAKANRIRRKDIDAPAPRWTDPRGRLFRELRFRGKLASFSFGNWFYNHQYRRVVRQLGGIAHPLVNMDDLAALAAPYYNVFARGGEGHIEVAKNIYYTVNKKAHMVLSLKPFGCMPSSQSDGVQSAVMNRFSDMIFLPIETAGEGEIGAHSRVQMALGEARNKARVEFSQALASTGQSLDGIRRFVDAHPVLRRPFYRVPHRPGVIGTAARFVLHVSDLMDGRARFSRLPTRASRGQARAWRLW